MLYEGGLRCTARHEESGVTITTDAPKENHGQGSSFSPSELLSVSLGSCVLSLMGIVARSMDLDIAGSSATVRKKMANAPRRIVNIAIDVYVPHPLTEEQATKLEAAAHACPVHNSLRPELCAPITFRWHKS
ncbi:OsmC family protein [Terriglobus tenax]|uniref:OsmC family protein n=1 Tax=Terriglobus tenax TaxID=1111115 RepID=UPI0021DFC88B|nr:OsmC family protein [Terriglobus tenax]